MSDIKDKIKKDNVREKYRAARDLLRQVKHVTKEPQHSVPDVFVWLICDRKRVAYARIPTRELLAAKKSDLNGKNCGKIQTLFLKVRSNLTFETKKTIYVFARTTCILVFRNLARKGPGWQGG